MKIVISISSRGTNHFVATNFNPLNENRYIISSGGTNHIVATDFNPLTMKNIIP